MSKSNNRGNNRNTRQAQPATSSGKPKGQGKPKSNSMRGKQGKKDSSSPRINADNERLDKFVKQFEKDSMRASVNANPNDISWYARNPELLKSAASLPFNQVLGQLMFTRSQYYIQGVMVIRFTFNFGDILSGRNDNGIEFSNTKRPYPEAINQAGKSRYSFLVHANSRNYVYEYQDLQILIMAGVQLFTIIAHCIRAYAFSKTYSEKSIYKPEAYLTAMGFDPIDFRDNLSTIWFDLNNLIAQTAQIWIPNDMPLLTRWIWLVSNVFTDAASALGQSYMFVPTHFLQYSEVGDTNGGSLEPATYPLPDNKWKVLNTSTPTSWQNWKGTVQHMIDRLVNSEDRGIMFGDILNAYGADKIYAFPSVPSDIRFDPVFNPEVLTQIENLTTTGIKCVGLRQDTTGLYPLFTSGDISKVKTMMCAPRTPILNFHQPTTPTPEQIVIATRLMSAGTITVRQNATFDVKSNLTSEADASVASNTTAGTVCVPLTMGSEVVEKIQFITKSATTTSGWAVSDFPYATGVNLTSADAKAWGTLTVPGDYVSFDWAPFVYYFSSTDAPELGSFMGEVVAAYGDYDNYTVLDFYEVSKLHQMALMSEFGLPIVQ